MTIHVTLQPPDTDSLGPSQVHDRTFTEVPADLAATITRDFEAYEREASDAERRKLYSFERTSGEKVLLALDFEDVVAVTTSHDAVES